MSDDSGQMPPDTWLEEPGDRLTRLAGAAFEAIEAQPEFGEDVKGILTLSDGNGQGSAMFGYEGREPEPVYDMIRASSHLFATLGLKLQLEVDGGPDVEQKAFEVPHPPLQGDGPHETVKVTLIVNPGDERLGRVGRAIKATLEAEDQDWGITKLVIMVKLEEESAILYHGLADEHELMHHLLHALAQVTESGGGTMILVPMGGGPN